MAKFTLNIGQELHSDSIVYRIESVLGQGSFGVTYKAKAFTVMKGKFGEELVETNTPKAIKEFFMKEVNERDESGSITGMSEGSLSYNYAQKFKKEAENLAGMNHPNIVKVIDFVKANNTFYYIMDYIEGENLNDYLKHHKLNEEEATKIILEVAKALKYMHEEKRMLHLDLKPGNIMRRSSDGHIFLIDFGLSKHYNDDGVPETSTSVGLGTPGYAPIEQANSKKAKQFRTTLDVYALGATYYKLLTGQTPPYADELVSDEDILSEKLKECKVSAVAISTIANAMKPNVKNRTQNVIDFINELQKDDSEISSTNDMKEETTTENVTETFLDNSNLFEEETVVTPIPNSPNSKLSEAIVETDNDEEQINDIEDNINENPTFKYYIPVSAVIFFAIGMIVFHIKYQFLDWGVSEGTIIGRSIIIFLLVIATYFVIIRNKINRRN